jgi:DUF438 domain-containing protein
MRSTQNPAKPLDRREHVVGTQVSHCAPVHSVHIGDGLHATPPHGGSLFGLASEYRLCE